MTDRFAVAAALREIALLLEVQGGNPHRARAYEKGARAIESLNQDLAVLARSGRLTEIPGIGEALARTITELVETGRTSVLDRLRQELPAGVAELATVLSLPRIQAVHQALGITTLPELEQAAREGRLRTVKGFGARTEQKVLQEIEDLGQRGQQTLLHHAQREADSVLDFVRALPEVERAETAGMLRRRLEVIDSLEIVVASTSPEAVLQHLARFPQAAAQVSLAGERGRWRLAGGMNLEAEVVAPERFALAWHLRTGSAGHLESLAAHAAARGLTIDERGLRRGSRKLQVPSEEELYRLLDLPYVPPEMREADGEVEAAAAGVLPGALVTADDVRGMVHCHTTWSDGRHTIEQMARAAEEMGMSYITITDHSPTATYAGGLTLDRLRRQWDEIDRVQQKVRVRLLRGSEVDILKDGTLDWPDRILEEMDVVVASIHNRYRLDEEAMTRRVVRGLRHPLFKVWGHALGRYVLRRPPIAVRMEEVLDAAAASRVAVEINGNPNRLDLEPRYVRQARRRGLRFTLSVDAHSIGELHHLRWAVDMARRGWLTPGDVLNTLDADAFAAAVHPTRAPARANAATA
jgi:DNA polymerase (family 10)